MGILCTHKDLSFFSPSKFLLMMMIIRKEVFIEFEIILEAHSIAHKNTKYILFLLHNYNHHINNYETRKKDEIWWQPHKIKIKINISFKLRFSLHILPLNRISQPRKHFLMEIQRNFINAQSCVGICNAQLLITIMLKRRGEKKCKYARVNGVRGEMYLNYNSI